MPYPATFLSPPRRLAPRERLAAGLLVLLALLPLGYIGLRAAEAGRNIAYWDEYETALALIMRLHSGITPGTLLDELFSVNNEHRMVMSRLIFTASYWLTGTVNFTFISLLGNFCLLGLCATLLLSARTVARRLRLGVVLALGMFQLENYENFLWSGSSIDHFQVLFYVGATVAALAHGTRTAGLLAALCAVCASLTLAHGLLVWPLGAVLLWSTGRHRWLLTWCGLAGLVGGGYLLGFSVNGAHHFSRLSFAGIQTILHYWLTLLGSVPALGHAALAPWFGAGLLGALAWLGRRGAAKQERIIYPLAWFGVIALALVAVGRAEQVGGLVMSRYVILSTLAWSLTAFLLLERFSDPRHPLTALAWCLPVFVLFNVAANRAYAGSADSWLDCRDIAAARFKQHGVDGRGNFALSPLPARATTLLHEAERRGVYRMGPVCIPRFFPAAVPSERILARVDELSVTDRSAFVRGWAAIPGLRSERGHIHLVLRSTTATHVFSTVSTQRPDVAANLGDPRLNRSGYLFSLRRDRLPSGDYQIGFLIKHGSTSEYAMTEQRLVLRDVTATGIGQ
jgi:hypothetical protein